MRGRPSQTQRMILFWAGVMAPAAEYLPRQLAVLTGSGSWLPLLLGAGLLLPALRLMERTAGSEGLEAAVIRNLGPKWGRGLLAVYLLWGMGLLTLRFRLCAQRLAASGPRDGTLWFFLLAAAGLTLWMGRGSLAAFARAGQLFFGILLGTMGVVLLLSLRHLDGLRLVPEIGRTARGLLPATFAAAGTVGWGLFAAFLPGTGGAEQRRGRGRFWILGGCGLLALGQAILLGCLGVGLVERLNRPFFALTQQIGIEGAFQRGESAAAALWTLADLCMAGVLVFAIQTIVEAISGKKAAWCPWCAVCAAGTAALILPIGESTAAALSAGWIPAGNLLLGLGVPGGLWLLEKKNGHGSDRAKKDEKSS